MKKKSLVAVAASIVASISLAASPAHAQSEEGTPWAAWLVGATVLAGWVLLALEDDDGDQPASP